MLDTIATDKRNLILTYLLEQVKQEQYRRRKLFIFLCERSERGSEMARGAANHDVKCNYVLKKKFARLRIVVADHCLRLEKIRKLADMCCGIVRRRKPHKHGGHTGHNVLFGGASVRAR